VLSVACKRSGDPLNALRYGIKTAFASPTDVIKEFNRLLSNRKMAEQSINNGK
jgi:hypothetical protein